MLYGLKRHPIPIVAHFDFCLVLTYAFPQHVLASLLAPGLVLDAHRGFGFVAIAMVQTRDLRPAHLPRFVGQDFFLAGYRVFTRFETRSGRVLRGLRILRSDTDRRRMVFAGNLLTHYNYQHADVRVMRDDRRLEIRLATRDGQADLHIIADRGVPMWPDCSVFANERDARRFAGPLPYTFDYEAESRSIVVIRGVRSNWRPELVQVQVRRNTFLEQDPFRQTEPILASAFYVEDIAYRWERGKCEPLQGARP